jgi:multicomponent Na+:H+ antiporter subunit G
VSVLIDIVSIVLVALGVFFFIAGTVGLLRFPDSLTRLHALTKADNLGIGLIVLGLLPRAADGYGALKLLAVWGLVLLASSTAAQLAAAAARRETDLAARTQGRQP